MSEHHDDAPLNSAGKLAKAFIHSKITAMIMLALTLAGMMALLLTPREYNPQIVVPAANIIVPKPGATPIEVSNMVVKPLEALLNSLSGVDHTFGYATNDVGVVTVQFKVGEDQEDSLVKLYSQLMHNRDKIPPDTLEPLVRPINVDDVAIMTLSLSSNRLDGMALRDVGMKVLEQLRNVPGVSYTSVMGGAPRTVNIWLDAQRLTLTGITLNQVSDMLKGANASLPIGEVVSNNLSHPLRVTGYLGSAAEVGDIIIGVEKGKAIYLKDVATIEEGAKEVDSYSHIGFGGEGSTGETLPSVTLAIAKKAGTNAVDVANDVLVKLEELKASMIPADVVITVTRDDGEKANEAVNTLGEHLLIAIGSVVIVLVMFLGWREAGIVTLTVPLILFVVFVVGLMAGQTINRITLFALILSLGLLVDAAIVVIENIHRHLHQGIPADGLDALFIRATNEIGNPTNIATMAVILAFIPMAFVTGMMGPFMAPIPFNVPVAMIASLLIAYIVVPWAARVFLTKKALAHMAMTHAISEKHEPKEDVLQRMYETVITPMIDSRTYRNLFLGAVVVLLIGALIMPAWQFIRPAGVNGPQSAMGVELKMLPNDNTNTFLLQIDMPAGSALETTESVAQAVGQLLAKTQHVSNYQIFTGEPAPIDFAALVRGDVIRKGNNFAQIRVNLTDKHHRAASSHEIAYTLNEALNTVRLAHSSAKIKIYETPPGPPVQAQIMAELYGPDYDKLRVAADEIETKFHDVYGMINQDNSVTANTDTYEITIDRERANLIGIVPAKVAKMLRDYVSGFSIGTLHLDDAREPVDILVRLPRGDRTVAEQLVSLRVTSMAGESVPLTALATIKHINTAKPIYTKDQHPVVFVGGELITSSPVYAVLAGDAWLDNQVLPKSGVAFQTANLGFVEAQPKDVMDNTLLWGGEMRLTLDVFRDMGSAFMVALVFIYLILVGYYKSFMLPVIVMGAIPLTMIGIFPGHWATGQAFTATSMIGVIALAGIVVRNSLLLIDFILEYRAQGQGLKEAVIEAGKVRFRPILLTALAIILGSAIMITDPVFGGLAVSLIFGTFVSTALTLVAIPLVYYIYEFYGAKRAAARAAQTA
jgi:multidrug efflux pump subunit AcrB